MNHPQFILLHDFFEIRGGGERLVLLLCQELGLDIGFGFWQETSYGREVLEGLRVFDLAVNSRLIGWRTLKHIKAFENKTSFLSRYHTVIYSGVVAPLAVRNHQNGLNLFYCHTPPRFIYDKKAFFLAQIPSWQRPALQFLIDYLQPRYEAAVAEMDIIIANSENVKNRIHHYLGKPSTVIYPPCDVERFTWAGQDDYYLSTARLDFLKGVDLIIKAFLQMSDKRLIIASSGPEFDRLRRLAGGAENITFTGLVDEDRLNQLIGHCIATLYVPKDEDFGMSPVESMAAGKPVIGAAGGGLLETIVDGETGLLVGPEPSPEDIIAAVRALTPRRALEMRQACEMQARKFDKKVFLEKMREALG
ncbi:Glycosyl transferase, group 1 [Nitrosococcus oceani ATCC 19707]|uniref:Glycosyl transferase, group 1 n=2 Tax=Nitrosococcus oceani TaxID=1229 RepID=Q3JD33_NITOC|nr:glycosyltransferase [Nitrosococcus oceani]ABA57263.1 Glycosyl transferase, group 1 [Nitrosococcus oceani ATCC 19707]KFI20237.1 glycosyl transferase family 1 [Nitrosococcus oceani C-27]GEM20135.1 glycosyl transferase family 1 [Nitrosococcus oceani]